MNNATLEGTYNDAVETLRASEFPQLTGSTYLDHAAMTPCPKSTIDGFASDMTTSLLGNPHSLSQSAQLASTWIDNIRLRALHFLGADPENYDLIFVSNATAGIKLVAEAFRASPLGFRFLYHRDSHTSVVGVREESIESLCLNTPTVSRWIADGQVPVPLAVTGDGEVPILFAYPAQSNLCGRRHPLSWPHDTRSGTSRNVYTLVDAAALAATAPLELGDSDMAPDFTVISFTKIFGFPDLAALVVRKQASHVFRWRKYFGGGTVDMVVCLQEQWHAPKTQFLHERLEDGTLPVHNIIALDTSLEVHARLFGPMAQVATHTRFLAARLYNGLDNLHHSSGGKVCVMYSENPRLTTNGPMVTFNVVSEDNHFISGAEFEKLAVMKEFHVRTGGLCNPGGTAACLDLQPWEMRRNFSSGFRCGEDSDMAGGKPTGVIRASLGAMSTVADVDRFVSFVDEFFRSMPLSCEPIRLNTADPVSFCVREIYVYPIKSCGGFRVPDGIPWNVRPEGLAWDREWVLVHRGTARALSQKQYPLMALLQPIIDTENGHLRISFKGSTVNVPISTNPTLFRTTTTEGRLSRVCGDQVQTSVYDADSLHDFFSTALGVPCELARFVPGVLGRPRQSKARIQKHQIQRGIGCPGESDVNHPILLANEGAILLVNSVSVDALSDDIQARGGALDLSPTRFRPNVVVGPSVEGAASVSRHLAYIEDGWSDIQVGGIRYTMAGACRRCQMVCVDQITGNRHEEPLATLSQTRRLDGKIFFGVHMYYTPGGQAKVRPRPLIKVGDPVCSSTDNKDH